MIGPTCPGCGTATQSYSAYCAACKALNERAAAARRAAREQEVAADEARVAEQQRRRNTPGAW